MIKFFIPLLIFWTPIALSLALLPQKPGSAVSIILIWLIINLLLLPWRSILSPPPFNSNYYEGPVEVPDDSEIPTSFHEILLELSSAVENQGFEHFLWLSQEMHQGDRTFLRVLRTPDRLTACSTVVSRSAIVPRSTPAVTEISYATRIDDTQSLVTTNFLMFVDLAPNWINLAIPEATTENLLKIHHARVADRTSRPVAYPETTNDHLALLRRDIQSLSNLKGYVLRNGQPLHYKRRGLFWIFFSARIGVPFFTVLRDRLRTRAELRRLGVAHLA